MNRVGKLLIIGDNCVSKNVAKEVARNGYNLVCIGFSFEGHLSYPGAVPVSLKGGPGCFTILLDVDNRLISEEGDFVLVAMSAEYSLPYNPSGKIISLESYLKGEYERDGIRDIVIYDTTEGTSLTSRWSELFEHLLSETQDPIHNYHIIAPQIKVAEDGLERNYRILRENGVIFYKPDSVILEGSGPYYVCFKDHIVNEDIRLKADLVVLIDRPVITRSKQGIYQALGIEMDNLGFPQASNELRTPCLTNRRGVLVVSPLPENLTKRAVTSVTLSALNEIRKLKGLMAQWVNERTILYEQGRCAYCLTCLRVCPHDAIIFNSRPNFLSVSCEECGICVANCPGQALSLTRFPYESIIDKAKHLDDNGHEIIILACRRTLQVYENYQDLNFSFVKKACLIELPCAGYVSENLLFSIAEMQRFKRIVVVGCNLDNCRTGVGTLRASKVIDRVNNIIKDMKLTLPPLSYYRLSSQDRCGLEKMSREILEGT